ncbi:MAG: hypothetical protein OEX11_06230 [Nitrosomonas sp.]|nr:hypothetical protein [Nitrosomonas sp.]
MFDRPNQLIFYANIVAIVFGAVVILFSDFFLTGMAFIICGILLILEQIKQNKSAFSILDLTKTLTIHDTSGSNATQTQKQVITACHVDNKVYWFKNIPVVDSISNFKINGEAPDVLKQENGDYHLCVKIPTELKVTNGFDLTLSYDYQNAFTKTEGMLTHVVSDDTRHLHLIVELPKGRSITSARVFCRHNGSEEGLLPPVVTGQKIETEITDPILGAEYCLHWNWPEDGIKQKIGRLF